MYISLHNQTHYSILDALSSPEELFSKAKDLGMKALAITDHGTFAGIWESYKIAKKKDIKLIVGCEFFFKRDPKQTHFNHVILLAKNAEGYRNMLSLNFEAFSNSPDNTKRKYPVVSWELLEKYSKGTICLTACGQGILAESIMANKPEETLQDLNKLISIFGKDNIAIEIQANNLKRFPSNFSKEIDQNIINRQLIKLSKANDLKLIPSCNSHYVNKEDHETHDTMLAIGSGQSVFSKFRLKYDLPEFYLKSEEDIISFFKRSFGEDFAKEMIANSVHFADMCEDPEWVNPRFSNPSGKEMPSFPVKNQNDHDEFNYWLLSNNSIFDMEQTRSLAEDVQYLRFRVEKGLIERDLNKNQKYIDRVKEELEVLEMKDFSSYMLVVMDFIEYAHKNNITIGTGRGCLSFDTQVLTKNGFKNLKDLNTLDYVYSHTGTLQQITANFEFDVKNEKVLRIESDHAYNDLVMTKDHKVFAFKAIETKQYKKAKEANSSILGKYKRYEVPGNPSWIQAKDLSVNDLIYTTFPTVIRSGKNLPDFFEVKSSSTKNSKLDLTIKINLDNNFLYLLGRFTGNGWLRGSEDQSQNGNYGVGLAFNSDDIEGINHFTDYFKSLGFNVCNYKHATTKLVQLMIYNKSLMELIKSFYPDYKSTSKTKHFPIFFRELNSDQLTHFINGLIDSDGSKKEKDQSGNPSNRWCVDSTSLRLILELKEAFLMLKTKCSIKTRKPFMRGKYLCNQSYKLRFKKSDFEKQSGVGYYSKITKITEEDLNKVYDITVNEDHSYLTTNGVVHNSVGGCVIAYLIGIHQADSLEYEMIFGRFLTKEKKGNVDIDMDICSSGRDQVKEYLFNKYGNNNSAQVSNFGTITPKVYARDISRSFELGGTKESAVSIGMSIADSIDKDDKKISDIQSGLFEEYCKKYPVVLDKQKLVGKMRNVATHAAGVVLGRRELKGLVPLRLDKDSQVCLELDKDSAEESGLVKMDLLGLKTLDIIDLARKLISENKKEIVFPPPLDDKETYELISRGDTGCIFQLGGSGGTTELCKKLKPSNIDDISAINSLARPALKDYRDPFIKARHGLTEFKLEHPALKRAFGRTYGFGLYEECLFFIAQDIAGWDPDQADALRKMTKDKGKYPEKVAKLRLDFIQASVDKGFEHKFATHIWDDIISAFSGYGFNYSHSILYSMISYQTAYLKAHFPVEWLLANLMIESSGAKQDKDANILEIKNELRMRGISVLPPDINQSQMHFTLVDSNTITTGFKALKSVGIDAINDIIEKRPFSSFQDFMARVDSSKVRANTIQALAASGAFRSFGLTRRQVCLYVSDYRKKLTSWCKKHDPSKESFVYPWKDEGEWNAQEIFALETKFMGESFSTPIRQAFLPIVKIPHVSLSSVTSLDNKAKIQSMAGLFSSPFEITIKKEGKLFGKKMYKFNFEDFKGQSCSVTVFPDCLDKLISFVKAKTKKREIPDLFAASFSASVNFYNDQFGLVINDIYALELPPPIPSDFKDKKDVKASEITTQSLSEIEDELINEGIILD